MRVLVTGGSSGIGEALVRTLTAAGDDVVFTFCRHDAKARAVAESTGATVVQYDLSSSESVDELAALVRRGEFDALVNNAAQPVQRQLVRKIPPDSFLAYQTAALRGVFSLCTSFADQARRRNTAGAIVNVLTAYTRGMPPAKLASYVTSKHALLGLTRSMAVEFIRYRIRVNAVSPALTRTEFIADLPEEFIAQTEASLPMERFATAAEVAAVIRFLLSPDASYIHGANIPIAGGQVC